MSCKYFGVMSDIALSGALCLHLTVHLLTISYIYVVGVSKLYGKIQLSLHAPGTCIGGFQDQKMVLFYFFWALNVIGLHFHHLFVHFDGNR